MRKQIIQQVENCKVIAIIRGVEPAKALKTAMALFDGGIRMLEITFDQKNVHQHSTTADIIRQITEHFQGKVFVGAGTVTTPELVELAAEAGAQFIISPNTSRATYCSFSPL